jgi:SAM-dependent methyltransferase
MDQKIVATYESWYEGKYKRADQLEKNLLEEMLRKLDGVESILEVGCGTTRFTRYFASKGYRMFGVDISPYMLGVSKTLWDGDLAQVQSNYIPFQDRSFDVVMFVTCFEYMRPPVVVMREAGRVSRKAILFGLMNRNSLPTLRRRIQVAFGRNPYYKTAQFYSATDMKKLAYQAFPSSKPIITSKTTLTPRWLGRDDSPSRLGAFLATLIEHRN